MALAIEPERSVTVRLGVKCRQKSVAWLGGGMFAFSRSTGVP